MGWLTKREQKVAECLGASITAKRECDVDKTSAQQVKETVDAVNALIYVLDDDDTAEQLLSWEENFYE